ncbi:ATP-binding protein [Rickettsia sp. 2024-CO-Wats]
MFGPPGTGKSRLVACLPSILPQMSTKQNSTLFMLTGRYGRWSVVVSKKK